MFISSTIEITTHFPADIRKDMETLLSKLSYNPIWQTIEWQNMLLNTGYAQKAFFIGIYEDKDLLAYALIEKRSIGLGQSGFFCVGGPIVYDSKSLEVLSENMNKLALQEKTVFLQAEPLSSMILPNFKTGYYKNFIETHTAVIDLTQDNEIILARMKPKGRYNIRVAEKAGVRVEQVPYSIESLDIFYGILSETLERDGFAANSKAYFRTFLRYLEEQKLGGLFLAKREEETIAAGIFVFSGKTALYYYGASSSDNTKRKYMASYLLQWSAIEEAKSRGCEVFDFLGIADPSDPDSPLAGVTDFKLRLTDETKEWPKSQILVMRKFVYTILRVKKVAKGWKNRFVR